MNQGAGEALGETLRPLLSAAGYTRVGVEEALGWKTSPSPTAAKTIAARFRLSAEEPLRTVIRFLFLGERVDERAAARSLSNEAVAELVEAGLAEHDEGTVRSHVRVQPHDDLLVVHDLALSGELPRDFVAPVAPGSLTLGGLTTRRSVGLALDIGTGCGVQALLAAQHSSRVVGVDVNPRALEFARAGAALTGVHNVEWRLGDFFAPVEGELFDLIVANPPFVLAADHRLIFRDSPQPGDEVSRRVVSDLPSHLADGGYGHVLCNWVRAPGEDAAAAPRAWLEGSGCDVWVLNYLTDDTVSYVAGWNRALADVSKLESEMRRWLERLTEAGIESITTGVVILRRRDGPNWFRVDEMPYAPVGSGSDHILRVFAANDELAVTDDRELLDATFKPVDGWWLEERNVYESGDHSLIAAQLRPSQGVGLRARLDARTLALVRRLDGKHALRELTDDHDVLAAVRDLYGAGFLTRVAQA